MESIQQRWENPGSESKSPTRSFLQPETDGSALFSSVDADEQINTVDSKSQAELYFLNQIFNVLLHRQRPKSNEIVNAVWSLEEK